MKRVFSILILLAIAGAAQAQYQPRVHTVGTTNMMILPPVRPSIGTNGWWPSTAYVRGDCIVSTNTSGQYFWCVTAGTSSNAAPVFPSGTNSLNGASDTTDGAGVVWRYINPVRRGVCIGADGSPNVSVALGQAAVSGRGMVIYGNGGKWCNGFDRPQPYQGPWYAIAASSTCAVSVHEE